MPRYDVHKRYREQTARRRRAYRSGFWGLATIRSQDVPRASIGLRIRVDGGTFDQPLGLIELHPYRAAPIAPPLRAPDPAEPLIAVCMATYQPAAADLERQISSLRGQTHRNWVCIISDDNSGPDTLRRIRRITKGDPRFELSSNSQRLGFYRNFEVALRKVPLEASYIALSDQDDSWYPKKLSTLVSRMRDTGSELSYADMRIVDERGHVLRPSFWRPGRRNNFTDLAGLLSINSVTGAASLFTRRVLDLALPFPSIGGQYHDHWLACVALSIGQLAYVDQPLQDYVQHSVNVLGYLGRPGPLNPGGLSPQHWYFTNVLGAMAFSREILARAGEHLQHDKRATLQKAAALTSPQSLPWLIGTAGRLVPEMRGLKIPAGNLWRWLLPALAALPPNRLVSVKKNALPAVTQIRRVS